MNIYAGIPVVSSFSPSRGPVGTLVTVEGENLTNTTSLVIGGVEAIIISNTDTKLVGMLMPGAQDGEVSVSTDLGIGKGASDFDVIPTRFPTVQSGDKLVGTGAIGPAQQGSSTAISADGKTVIVGGRSDNNLKGAAWVFSRNGTNWSQEGTKLIGTSDDLLPYAYQGCAVDLSADGNTAIIGGNFDDGQEGAAWVFVRTDEVWSQQGEKLVGTRDVGVAFQGSSVSLSADGSTALIGGYVDDSYVGAAWVFVKEGDSWIQQGEKLVGNDAVGSAWQAWGSALSADGNTVVIGGSRDNGSMGAVWIFVRDGDSWIQQGSKLVGSGSVGQSYQGTEVDISADGNTIIFGGYGDNNYQGAAWVFKRNGNTWLQDGAKLVGTGNIGEARQSSVSLSADGNVAIIGGNTDNNSVGAFWVWRRINGSWAQIGSKRVAMDISGDAHFGTGTSLSPDGMTATFGGYNDNSGEGAAWVFTASAEARLASLTTSNGVLNPSFSPTIYAYALEVGYNTNSVSVTPTLQDAYASLKIRVNGGAFQGMINGTESTLPGLNEGENLIEVEVTALDGVSSHIYSVEVKRAFNTAPTNIELDKTSIDENLGENHLVGQLTVEDFEGGEISYVLVGSDNTDNSVFGISGNELLVSPNPDFEFQNIYHIKIRAKDAGGLTFEKDFEIKVNDLNEPPTRITLSNAEINEGSEARSVVGSFGAVDPDASENHTFSLVSGSGDLDNQAFELVDGQLVLVDTPDFEEKQSYQIRVRVSDKGSLDFEQEFVIDVIDLPEEKLDQTISFAEIDSQNLSARSKRLTATASSGLPIVYSISGPVNLFETELVFVGAGDVTVLASQAGNEVFNPANSIERKFTIIDDRLGQTIELILPEAVYEGEAPISLNEVASSGLPIEYSIQGPGLIESSQLTVTGPGLIEIIASQAGNDQFKPAPSIEIQIVVKPLLSIAGKVAGTSGEGLDGAIYATRIGEGESGSAFTSLVDGLFEVNSLKDGSYYIRMIPGEVSSQSYISTYYSGTALRDLATIVELTDSNLSDVNWQALRKIDESGLAGSSTIKGTVVMSTSDAGSASDTGETLVSEAAIYLYDVKENSLLAERLTNSVGTFEFRGLTTGNYRLYVDIVDKPVEANNLGIELQTNQTIEIKISVGQNAIDAEQIIVKGIELKSPSWLKVYPNPVSDNLVIENFGEIGSGQTTKARLIDLSGQEKLSGEAIGRQLHLDLQHQLPGIYILQVVINGNGAGYYYKVKKQ